MKTMFHLSLPCKDVEKTKVFYLNNLQADLGRNTNNWVDINLFGNQITFTKSGQLRGRRKYLAFFSFWSYSRY